MHDDQDEAGICRGATPRLLRQISRIASLRDRFNYSIAQHDVITIAAIDSSQSLGKL